GSNPGGYHVPTSGTVVGSYQWDSHYSGDAHNNPSDDINNPNELVTVTPATPSLSTTILQPSGAVPPAGHVLLQHRAIIANGFNPTGTITFDLFTGSNPGGSFVLGTHSTKTVTANGNYDSTAVSVILAAGSYHWVVSYTGDPNNTAPPNVENEVFTVG